MKPKKTRNAVPDDKGTDYRHVYRASCYPHWVLNPAEPEEIGKQSAEAKALALEILGPAPPRRFSPVSSVG